MVHLHPRAAEGEYDGEDGLSESRDDLPRRCHRQVAAFADEQPAVVLQELRERGRDVGTVVGASHDM
jgi:hypothetical protein